MRYKNPIYDELLKQAQAETEPKKRMELLMKCDQMLIDDAVIMPLYYEENTRLLNIKVRNFDQNPMEVRDFTRVYFDQSNSGSENSKSGNQNEEGQE
jgi:peptide/nickel transport system substrate-binding protein